jgi:hypothetical protein
MIKARGCLRCKSSRKPSLRPCRNDRMALSSIGRVCEEGAPGELGVKAIESGDEVTNSGSNARAEVPLMSESWSDGEEASNVDAASGSVRNVTQRYVFRSELSASVSAALASVERSVIAVLDTSNPPSASAFQILSSLAKILSRCTCASV